MERRVIDIDGTLTDIMFMAEVCAGIIIIILLLVSVLIIYGLIDLFNWIKKI